jgi:hypothetical protein
MHTPFLTSALDIGKMCAQLPGQCSPEDRSTRIGGWVLPKAGLEVTEKRFSCPNRKQSPAVQAVPYSYTD